MSKGDKLYVGFLGAILTVVVGIALFGAWTIHHLPVASPPPQYTALACTDALNKFVVVGVSKHVVRYPNYYEVTANDGEVQTYSPSAFETCATMSAETAVAKGLMKR